MNKIQYIIAIMLFLGGTAQSIGVASGQTGSQGTRKMLLLENDSPSVETFWRGGDHWALKGEAKARASVDLIQEAEAKFGIKFPQRLKLLYERSKGGYTNFAWYPRVSAPGPSFDDWRRVLVDGDILPPHRLETLEELADMTDFGDEDLDYRNLMENADRVIVLSRHGWDAFLCLDYRKPESEVEPEVVYYQDDGDGLKEMLRVPNFDTFFSGLRREKTD